MEDTQGRGNGGSGSGGGPPPTGYQQVWTTDMLDDLARETNEAIASGGGGLRSVDSAALLNFLNERLAPGIEDRASNLATSMPSPASLFFCIPTLRRPSSDLSRLNLPATPAWETLWSPLLPWM